MKYQLIVQWSSKSIGDYDAMIEAEDALIDQLTEQHKVDGHDSGSGEVNIFIQTDNLESAFSELKMILETEGFWEGARVGYREADGEQYFAIWPRGLKNFNVV